MIKDEKDPNETIEEGGDSKEKSETKKHIDSENCDQQADEIKDDVDDQECSQKSNDIDYRKEYEKLLKEKEDLNNSYTRLQADFTNYKKRSEKEKQSIYKYACEELVTELLAVIDNFDRALNVDDKFKEDSFYQGVRMLYEQLMEILKKIGLEEIEAKDETFDPNFHYAVMQDEAENKESNTVTEVLQKGYKLKDKVIRPSMVKVSK